MTRAEARRIITTADDERQCTITAVIESLLSFKEALEAHKAAVEAMLDVPERDQEARDALHDAIDVAVDRRDDAYDAAAEECERFSIAI